MRSVATTLVLATALGATTLGCGSSRRTSDGKLLAGSTASGVASSSFTGLPQGQQVFDGPPVTIMAPERGTVVQSNMVDVWGYADDPDGSGVTAVNVAGTKAAHDPTTGEFRAQVPLEPGINTIVVEAWDDLGRRTERHVSVMAGPFGDENTTLPQVTAVRLTNDAFRVLEPVMGDGIEAQKPDIQQQVLATPLDDADITGFDFGTVRVELKAVPGGMDYVVRIANVRMDIKASAKILLVFNKDFRGTVTANELRLEGTAFVDVRAGQTVTQAGPVNATATGFAVPDFARSEYRNILTAFEAAFAKAASDNVKTALDQAFSSSSTKGTLSRALLDSQILIDWELESLVFDADGGSATFASNVRAETPRYGTLTGSLVESSPLPNLVGGGAGPNVALALHQNVMNRALHAAWRAGALDLTIDQAKMNQLLPNLPTQMDTTALIASVPQLGQLLPTGLPFELVVECLLPPTVIARPNAPQLLDMRIGGLKVRMNVIHPTEGPLELTTTVYSINLPVAFQETPDGKLSLVASPGAEVHVDVDGLSVDGAEQVLEQLTQPSALQASLAQVEGVAIPAFKGISVRGFQFSNFENNVIGMGTATAVQTP
jgi:hypothetical protein